MINQRLSDYMHFRYGLIVEFLIALLLLSELILMATDFYRNHVAPGNGD